jgi:uncharacterized RDD family membrane protein YckC
VYVPQAAHPVEEVQAPQRVVVAQAHAAYAGFWRRAAAYFIDIFILSSIFGIIASLYLNVFITFPNPNAAPVPGPIDPAVQAFIQSMPRFTPTGYLLLFVMMWVYYALFEASKWQATPGKRLLRLYVTDMMGQPITFWRASLRYFGRKISELTFLVGYFIAGFTQKKQALHDIMAGCLVLRRP